MLASYLHFTAGPEAKKVDLFNIRIDFISKDLNRLFCQYLDIAQKILKNDKVLSQKCANVPNAVEESSCLMQADSNFMYVGMSQPCIKKLKAFSER